MNLANLLPHKIFEYQLYIFQLEEYDIGRFARSLFQKGLFPPESLRKKVKWTSKATVLSLVALFIQILLSFIISYLLYSYVHFSDVLFIATLIVILYALFILTFVFLIQAQDIIYPLEVILKNRLINRAKNKIKKLPNLEIIGITGSYGKTTMKEVLSTILSENFKLVKTEGNNNTPLGIARTILNKITEDTEIFVVEMGEYVKGDVKALCEITPPDIAIITGINEAHLERYRTMQNAIDTKFEIVEYAKPEATVILNADDENIVQNFERFKENKYVLFYSSQNNNLATYHAKNFEFYNDGSGQAFEIFDKFSSIGTVKTPILAEYVIGNVSAGVLIGKMLGMKDGEIRLGISKIKPVDHRLQVNLNANNILIIDDTYNGNSDGVREGIKLLSKFDARRKVYVTPGLVETGELSKAIHYEIGNQLAKVADFVILIKNSVTQFIYEGLIDSGFSKDNIIWYDSPKETWDNLYSNLKANDVVLLQNDWSDNYS